MARNVDRPIERIAVVGLGKLGLPIAACYALAGLTVVGIDRDASLIRALSEGRGAFTEPGLMPALAAARPRMSFTTDMDGVRETDATLVVVPTPSDPETGRFSLAAVENVARAMAAVLEGVTGHVLIVASTVMPGGVSKELSGIVRPRGILLAYMPEFVALGRVIADVRHPDFVLIGADDRATGDRIATLQRRVVGAEPPVEIMSIAEAEVTKVALNGFLCMKIAFGNFLAQYAAAADSSLDASRIAHAIGHDRRIGVHALSPGMPFGGPCLPRDTRAFAAMSAEVGLSADHLEAAGRLNKGHARWIASEVAATGRSPVGILGLAYKPGTDVVEESPSWTLIEALLEAGRSIVAFDSTAGARDATRQRFGDAVLVLDDLDDCLARSESIVLAHPDAAFAAAATHVGADVVVHDICGTTRRRG